MQTKHYKADTSLKLRVVDVNLIGAVINGLGELSGSDIELLGSLCDVISPDGPIEAFVEDQRSHPTYQKDAEYTLTVSHVQFMLNLLFGQVKAFTAKDIMQVREIRRRLQAALVAAEISSTSNESEESEDSSDKE